ncbi:MAG: hypothetical protein ABI760_11955 [Ferruginibacter sp.]
MFKRFSIITIILTGFMINCISQDTTKYDSASSTGSFPALPGAASFRPPGQVNSMEITLNLAEADNSTITADGALVEFSDNFNTGVDLQDAIKFTNPNETFGFMRNGTSLAIERRPFIDKNDTLFLNLIRSTQRNYQLVIVGKYPDQPNLLAFIEDKYRSIATPLSLVDSTIFNFTINGDAASIKADRFRIVFKLSSVLPVTISAVTAWKQGNNIALKWNVENQLSIKRYEIEKSTNGVNFTKVNTLFTQNTGAATQTYNWLDIHAIPGDNFYRIRNVEQDGSAAYSKVVKVNIGRSLGGMVVFPNPVVGGVMGLQFNNMDRGHYRIRMQNGFGQVLFIGDINHPGGSAMERISISKEIAKGIYNLEITNPDKGSTIISVLIQ